MQINFILVELNLFILGSIFFGLLAIDDTIYSVIRARCSLWISNNVNAPALLQYKYAVFSKNEV